MFEGSRPIKLLGAIILAVLTIATIGLGIRPRRYLRTSQAAVSAKHSVPISHEFCCSLHFDEKLFGKWFALSSHDWERAVTVWLDESNCWFLARPSWRSKRYSLSPQHRSLGRRALPNWGFSVILDRTRT